MSAENVHQRMQQRGCSDMVLLRQFLGLKYVKAQSSSTTPCPLHRIFEKNTALYTYIQAHIVAPWHSLSTFNIRKGQNGNDSKLQEAILLLAKGDFSGSNEGLQYRRSRDTRGPYEFSKIKAPFLVS